MTEVAVRALRSLFFICLCLFFSGASYAASPLAKANDDFTFKGNEVRVKSGARVIRLRFPAPKDRRGGTIGIANPASVHCANLGGKLETRTGDGGEYAMCHLPDGTVCEEWALFRKECPSDQPRS